MGGIRNSISTAMDRAPLTGEVIPPSRAHGKQISDEQLDQIATLLDDIWAIPGTRIRIGLDPILGLVPGIGDVISGLISFLIIFAAWQRRLPKVTIVRMLVNEIIDTVVGSIPIFGDAFDVMWKSNRMNYNLILRHRAAPERSHSWKDWLFLAALALAMVALAVLPFVVLFAAIHYLRH